MAAERCEASDEELVLAAQADCAAFVTLYRRYADPVYRYCWRRVETRELAEDLTAQTFVKALAALPNFHAGSFRAWLFAIAHNALSDGYRTSRSHAPLEAAEGLRAIGPEPETAALLDETRRELRAALNDLPAEQRDVIELRLAGRPPPRSPRRCIARCHRSKARSTAPSPTSARAHRNQPRRTTMNHRIDDLNRFLDDDLPHALER